ncbi:MAG: RsmD family RNA methyltransferase, partial [Selenomonadaceae bacterium]|nr:RsmD family RNA methyltransferase [Selenomonadaceae bacterium]
MRIITGKARGLKLRTPAGLSTRPTSDRVKESLFSILSGLIDFADVNAVLDIFAGT